MKKSLLTLLGVGLLLTSCQSDEPFAPVEGGEKQVTFTLTAPTSMTRAGEQKSSNLGGLSNKATDDVLHYTLALYYGDNLEWKDSKSSTNGSVEFNPTVILGRNYRVVAYADFVGAKDDLKQIAITNGINNEKKDAYFANPANVVFTENDLAEQVTLTRPFGKLRLVATDYSDKTQISNVSVKYRNGGHLNSFNAFSGEFAETTDATATYYDAVYDVEYDEEDGEKTIFVDYIPVNSDGVFPFEITVTYTNGTESFKRTFAEDIPVKRNALTTLKGKFFTAEAKISVAVDEDFDGGKINMGTETVSVATVEDLNNAIANPNVGKVVLTEDIDFEGFVFGAPASSNAPSTRAATVIAGRNVIIDGNGKTLTYKGAPGGRIIDFKSETNGANLTLKNLTIINNVSWIERAVNYNTNGTLTLEGVIIKSAEGCSLNYAINLPASSANAKVEIKNCEIWAGAQALNLWGERTMVNVTNSALYVVDNSAEEGRSVVAINNNGETIADYCVLDFNGGSIQVVYVGEGETKPSYAIRNNTAHSTINVSPETNVVGEISNPVAIIYWEGQNQYYSLSDLNAALDAAVPEYKATGVRMIKDLTLPLAKKAIYGTPVAVQMKNGGVFDGCNNTLSVENPVYEAYVVETYGGTIKNLNITTPAGRGIIISSPKEDICLDNVYVNGPGYALNTTEHNGKKLVVTNSTFKGWTSLAGLENVSFTSCTFGENTYYYWQKFGYDKDYDRLIRPYVATSFNSCVFEEGFYIDLSALAADKKVTLKDCVCGNVELTAENYSQYITIELPSGRTLAECVVFE